MKKLSLFLLVVTFLVAACSLTPESGNSKIEPSNSNVPKVTVNSVGRLTGVNWFGFETGNYAPHGLWTRDYKSMLKQIKDLGFNHIRLPWCNYMLTAKPSGIQINPSGVDAYTKQVGLNLDLEGLSSIQVMDKIIQECDRIGLKVVLDNHSRANDGYMNETLWYTASVSEDKWIEDWVFLINRYKNNPSVVGADLNNEPHGNTGQGMKPPATWGYNYNNQNTDWRKAAIKCAKAILAANPNIIIIIEGVEEYITPDKSSTNCYWWGGNLMGVKDYPISSSDIPSSQLMYSFHEYGPEVYNQPWFSDPNFPNNMPGIWDKFFWFIYKENIGSLYLGEFGIKEESAANTSSVAYKWFTTLMSYVGNKCHWAFWCMNPNSGDTGGILKDDWVTVNTAKYNLIKPYLAGFTSSSSSSISSSSSSISSSSSSISSSSSSVSSSSSISSSSSSVSSSSSSSISSSSSSVVSSSSSSVSSSSSSTGGNYVTISLPFSYDGAGEFYWKTDKFSTTVNWSRFVNSWNVDVLEINGVNCANKWVAEHTIPPASDGYWYIHYKASYSWSHVEIK